MAQSRPWLALAALAAFVIACGGSVVEPTSPDSAALSLSAPLLVRADYAIDLKHVGGGYNFQEDVIVSRRTGGGVSASGNWKTLIRRFNEPNQDIRGTISCTKLEFPGARLGGVVTQSPNPADIGATMVATIKDGTNDDSSTGVRIFAAESGISAQEHCTTGYSNATIGLNGVSTFQKIRKGFIDIFFF